MATPDAIVEEPDAKNRNGPRDGRRRPMTVDMHGGTAVRRPIGYRRRRKEVPARHLIHERRAKCFQLLAGDFTHLKIGRYLHADPSMCTNKHTPDGCPGGYGWQNYANGKPPLRDEALRASVSRDIHEGLAMAAKYESYSRDQWVAQSLNTLAETKAAIWQKVLDGQISAVEQVVAIEARKAKLLGLDQPDRVETSSSIEVVVGVAPEMDRAYMDKMVEALTQVGAVKALEAPEGDVLDVDGVEVPEAEVVRVDAAGGP